MKNDNMNTIETIRTFRTENFTIHVRAVEDCDLDLSFDDSGEIAKKLNTGELSAFGVIVSADYKGSEITEDSLWGCIYANPKDFMDHRLVGAQNRQNRAEGKKEVCGSYFSDMVKNVCRQAREKIHEMQTIALRA